MVDIHGPGARFIFRGNIIGCNQIVGMCKAFTANSKPHVQVISIRRGRRSKPATPAFQPCNLMLYYIRDLR